MRAYKQIENGYIAAIGYGFGGVEISPEEYASLSSLIDNRPIPPEGYDYRLRDDLTWEEYQMPVIDPEEEEISDSEALAIILGGGA